MAEVSTCMELPCIGGCQHYSTSSSPSYKILMDMDLLADKFLLLIFHFVFYQSHVHVGVECKSIFCILCFVSVSREGYNTSGGKLGVVFSIPFLNCLGFNRFMKLP